MAHKDLMFCGYSDFYYQELVARKTGLSLIDMKPIYVNARVGATTPANTYFLPAVDGSFYFISTMAMWKNAALGAGAAALHLPGVTYTFDATNNLTFNLDNNCVNLFPNSIYEIVCESMFIFANTLAGAIAAQLTANAVQLFYK